jgi:hypothetical protein
VPLDSSLFLLVPQAAALQISDSMMSSSSSLASTNSSIASQSSFEELANQVVQRRRERQRQLIVISGGRKKGGSRPGKRRNVDRRRGEHEAILMQDYFNANPVYDDKFFRRRFRMRHCVFDRVLNALTRHDRYFVQKTDALGVLGFSPHQKITCALRFLAYGTSADQLDEYIRMAESTVLVTVSRFCSAVIACFSETYLRSPTVDDLKFLLKSYEKTGWIGCLGCLDVMKWQWKNCPMAWRGAYQGKEKVPTIALEAIVDHRLWFWHLFFGMPGANNDLNILDCSPLFKQHMDGTAPKVRFTVNNNNYDMGYYLTDGIYPDWALFMKTIAEPSNIKQEYFAEQQEARRKDVEHGFGVLQVCFLFFSLSYSSFSLKLIIIWLAYCQIFLTRHDGEF